MFYRSKILVKDKKLLGLSNEVELRKQLGSPKLSLTSPFACKLICASVWTKREGAGKKAKGILYLRSRTWRRMTALKNVTGIVDKLALFVIRFRKRYVSSQGGVLLLISFFFFFFSQECQGIIGVTERKSLISVCDLLYKKCASPPFHHFLHEHSATSMMTRRKLGCRMRQSLLDFVLWKVQFYACTQISSVWLTLSLLSLWQTYVIQ